MEAAGDVARISSASARRRPRPRRRFSSSTSIRPGRGGDGGRTLGQLAFGGGGSLGHETRRPPRRRPAPGWDPETAPGTAGRNARAGRRSGSAQLPATPPQIHQAGAAPRLARSRIFPPSAGTLAPELGVIDRERSAEGHQRPIHARRGRDLRIRLVQRVGDGIADPLGLQLGGVAGGGAAPPWARME